jgi:plastocyanin domain-containing protein
MRKITGMLLLALISAFLLSLAWGAGKPEVYHATIDSSGVQKIEMKAGDFYFKPNTVIVKKNVPVVITVKEEPGFASHSIVLHAPEAGIDFDVDLGTDAKTIRFTPTRAGRYSFYCDKGLIESHRSKGMEGVLEVTE